MSKNHVDATRRAEPTDRSTESQLKLQLERLQTLAPETQVILLTAAMSGFSFKK